jgi:hypothetical protein
LRAGGADDRYIQQDQALYEANYPTANDRAERLTLLSGISPARIIGGIDRASKDTLALIDLHVIPSGQLDGRLPWLMMTMVVVNKQESASSITQDHEVEVCGPLDIQRFVESRGVDGFSPQVCDTGGILKFSRTGSYIPVHLLTLSAASARLLLVPTVAQFDMYVVDIAFIGGVAIGAVSKRSLATPDAFTSNSKLPSRPAWAGIARVSALVSNIKTLSTSGVPRMTQGGVVAMARRVLAQNAPSLGSFLDREGVEGVVTVFVSNDPDAPTHWMSQVLDTHADMYFWMRGVFN